MCTLLAQCASPRIGCWHSRGYAYTASRAGQSRGTTHLLRTAPVPLSWTGKRGGLVLPMWDQCGIGRAIDSSELRLTTDREGRQVGQHRSHIVAAVSSACLIARAAASGSQGRIVSSLSPGRPRADVGLSLSGLICRRSVRPIRSEFSDGWRVYLCVLLEISPNLPST